MPIFFRELIRPLNAAKSLGGALFMAAVIAFENRENPIDMYFLALCGQVIYSFFVGSVWMSLYQSGKKKYLKIIPLSGILVALMTALLAAVATWCLQTILMNPEAYATACWAFGLSSVAFLGNEFLVRVDPKRNH